MQILVCVLQHALCGTLIQQLHLKVLNQSCHLGVELLPASNEVHNTETAGSLRIDHVASAKEPRARRSREAMLRRNAHHSGQRTTLNLRKAKRGILVCKHGRRQAREGHAAAARIAVAYNNLGHQRSLQTLEQGTKRS